MWNNIFRSREESNSCAKTAALSTLGADSTLLTGPLNPGPHRYGGQGTRRLCSQPPGSYDSRETGLLWPGLQGHPGVQLFPIRRRVFRFWSLSQVSNLLRTLSHAPQTLGASAGTCGDSSGAASPSLRHHWCRWMTKKRTFSVLWLSLVSSQGARLALPVGYRPPAESWAANPISDSYFPKIRR